MRVVCPCGGYRLKLMWDRDGGGLWCAACHRPVDPRGLPLAEGLARRLEDWNRRCVLQAEAELGARRRPDPEAWAALLEEGRALRRELDRCAPTYLYRMLPTALPEPRCPDCGRHLGGGGGAGGFAWGICEECQLWIAYPERGRA